MNPALVAFALIAGLSLTTTAVSSAFPTDDLTSMQEAAVPALDVVTLKDGSVIHGEVIEMVGGVLQIKSWLADDLIKFKWGEVSKLSVSHPIPFHLKEGTILVGTAEEAEAGTIKLKEGSTGSIVSVPMDAVTQVNPIVQPPVIYSGSLNAAYSQATGNSQLRNVSLVGDFIVRSEKFRLTMLGRYVYGDNAGSLFARNARGTVKLDYFITKRLFWFVSAYVENDFFQNVKLRTAIASGPGYQWIERGDFGGIFKEMTFYTEVGPGYFNENYRDNTITDDTTSFRGRVAMKWDWPLFDDRITLFHHNEIFPSLQTFSDFFFTMDNGVRMKILAGLKSGFQVTTRYNNRPPAGTGDTDNLYLLTLGYAFDTTRKR